MLEPLSAHRNRWHAPCFGADLWRCILLFAILSVLALAQSPQSHAVQPTVVASEGALFMSGRRVCSCMLGSDLVGRSVYGDTAAVLQINADTGIDYCVHPYVDDDVCQRIRPIYDGDPGPSLGEREAVLSPNTSLNDRFVLWTLALAPESVYRHSTSVDVINRSPLAQDFVGASHINTDIAAGFPVAFNSAELHVAKQAPADTWLFQVAPNDGRIYFEAVGAFGLQGGFPAASFTLAADYTVSVAVETEVFLYDPCNASFASSQVDDGRFNPATGVFSLRIIDEALAQRLSACWTTLRASSQGSYYSTSDSTFLMVIDQSPQRVLSDVLSTTTTVARRLATPTDPRLHGQGVFMEDIAEVEFLREGKKVAYLRTAVFLDCGTSRTTTLQFRDGAGWSRLSMTSELEFCSP